MTACDICGLVFENVLQIGPHKRHCWARHCVHVGGDFSPSSPSPPSSPRSSTTSAPSSPASVRSSRSSLNVSPTPLPTPLHSLASRECGLFWGDVEITNVANLHTFDPAWTASYVAVQRMWKDYVVQVESMCAGDFWLLFGAVHNATTQCVNNVFAEVYRLLKRQPNVRTPLGHKWPRSLRSFLNCSCLLLNYIWLLTNYICFQ